MIVIDELPLIVTLETYVTTSTVHVAEARPFLAVIVALPLASADTLPSLSTVATSWLLLSQVTSASAGQVVAAMVWLSPTPSVRELRSNEMDCTTTVMESEKTSPVDVTAFAVTVASPPDTAFTVPSASTVTTSESELDHSTPSKSSASTGVIVTPSFTLFPTVMVRVSSPWIASPMSLVKTVTSQEVEARPLVAVIVVFPFASAVTVPSRPTVAMAVSSLDQVTDESSGKAVATRV